MSAGYGPCRYAAAAGAATLRGMTGPEDLGMVTTSGVRVDIDPAAVSREGGPIGARLLTPSGDEGLLLALAGQLEQASSRPPLAPGW